MAVNVLTAVCQSRSLLVSFLCQSCLPDLGQFRPLSVLPPPVSLPGMHSPSFLLRATRALVGLVTLWCLGCSSYESLVGSLLGNAGMECATGIAAASSGDAPQVATLSVPSGAHDFDCGCGGWCHAPTPQLDGLRVAHGLAPIAPVWRGATPSSVSRAPLLPPPEFPV
jgi:hypothetical protein